MSSPRSVTPAPQQEPLEETWDSLDIELAELDREDLGDSVKVEDEDDVECDYDEKDSELVDKPEAASEASPAPTPVLTIEENKPTVATPSPAVIVPSSPAAAATPIDTKTLTSASTDAPFKAVEPDIDNIINTAQVQVDFALTSFQYPIEIMTAQHKLLQENKHQDKKGKKSKPIEIDNQVLLDFLNLDDRLERQISGRSAQTAGDHKDAKKDSTIKDLLSLIEANDVPFEYILKQLNGLGDPTKNILNCETLIPEQQLQIIKKDQYSDLLSNSIFSHIKEKMDKTDLAVKRGKATLSMLRSVIACAEIIKEAQKEDSKNLFGRCSLATKMAWSILSSFSAASSSYLSAQTIVDRLSAMNAFEPDLRDAPKPSHRMGLRG